MVHETASTGRLAYNIHERRIGVPSENAAHAARLDCSRHTCNPTFPTQPAVLRAALSAQQGSLAPAKEAASAHEFLHQLGGSGFCSALPAVSVAVPYVCDPHNFLKEPRRCFLSCPVHPSLRKLSALSQLVLVASRIQAAMCPLAASLGIHGPVHGLWHTQAWHLGAAKVY
jgi:hypothetical protein